MTDRLLILVLIFGGIAAGGLLMRTYNRRRRDAIIESMRLEPSAAGQARILTFYGPSCDACDRQKSVLADLERAYPGRFSSEFRDATVDYDYAQQFGLTVVPTTVVIGSSGSIAAINSGFTSRTALEAQLDAA
ncbi:MAG: conjugal transfer protein TraF [Thermomicrobiales bacterium]|nr:conjugal transfer protein TraF [Thermomicrobiales bacterium]MCO5219976.1 conjugal transfer protein TraF [Thermomicrobiales bacterium]